MPAVRVVALGGFGGLLDSLGVAHLPLNLLESGGDWFRGGLRLILLSEGRVSHPALVLRLVNLLLMSLFSYSRLLLLGGFGSLNGFGVLVALLGKSNLLLLFLGHLILPSAGYGKRVFDLGMFLQRPLGFLVGNALNLLRDDGLLGTKPCKLRLLARDLEVIAKCIELLVEV